MKNREYIDQIKILLNSNFSNHKEKFGVVTREFFESDELKLNSKAALKALENFGYPKLNDDRFDQCYKIAINECRHSNQTGMSPSISLVGEQAKNNNWLTEARMQELHWESDFLNTYRNRYFAYLEKIGRSKEYIDETKRSSIEILRKLGDPKSQNNYFVKGLVVGGVQSGKTANFNAVINSSIDAGYDLIIVLSGIIEDLRRQTQRRIEKEVEGKYEGGLFIGVGEISSFGPLGYFKEVRQIVIPTSQDIDFNKSMKEADFNLNNKNILICKKNTSVLKNLMFWLHTYLNKNKDKIGIPFLIIDDEADNASLNNLGAKGREVASTINKEIRALLALFNKKTYLGYTATPFGNVLQDRNEAPTEKWNLFDKINGKTVSKQFDLEESLFPNDFIELLFPPPNYIGAKHFFETKLGDIKKIDPLIPSPVRDYLESYPSRVWKESGEATTEFGKDTRATVKADSFPLFIPTSLKEAIMCFIVSTGIRISRKAEMFETKQYQPHNTMLIHISRFITWQTKTKNLVQDFIDELTCKLNNDLPSSKDSIYGEFEKIWNKYYAYVMENIKNYLPDDYEDDYLIPKTFKDIKPLLITSIKDMEVKAINSETGDTLFYPDKTDRDFTEKKYIAIGGNRLSRGFTLEGLTINYFIRNTNYADTLLQMGRWFGYRPGYIDCCKLFSTPDSLEKFDLTTETIEDLEQKFIEMNRPPGDTPFKFALRVLKHPGTLKITRPSILKNTEEVNWSYSDTLVQTTKFVLDAKRIESSWHNFKSHINSLALNKSNIKGDYIIYETDEPAELFKFLNLSNTFNFNDDGKNYFRDIIQFIKLCNQENKLKNWSIAIKIRGNGRDLSVEESKLPCIIERTLRGGPKQEYNSRWYDILKNNKIFGAGQASANIVTGSKDMSIRLTLDEIKEAENDFKNQHKIDLKKKNSDWDEDRLNKEVKKANIPEKVFRNKMKDNEGVLMIYLMDIKNIFENKGEPILGLDVLINSLNFDIPLIGYAIGIPTIEAEIGGIYLQSKFHVEPEPPALDDDEFDDYKDILQDNG
jgi:hypothetical protein